MEESKNPWKTNSIKSVYENDWIALEHHEVLNPSDNPGIYGKIHFKNIAIGIIPVDEEGNTWLVGQYRYPLDQFSWEIPEGGGPLNIAPIDSAKRELLEETGISANEWTSIQEIHTSNSVSDEFGIIFLAKQLQFGEAKPDDNEELTVKKLPLKEALRMVLDGEITDSLSVAGILSLKEKHPELFR